MDATQLEEVQEQRTKLVIACQAVVANADLEGRDLNEQDQTELDGNQETIDQLSASIEQSENDARRQRLEQQVSMLAKPVQRQVPPAPYAEAIQASGIKVFTRRKSVGPIRGFDNEEQAHKAGMWLKAQLGGDEEARQWCSWNVEKRVLLTTNNISAGYLVPDEFEAAVITNREDFGVARQHCTIMGMGSNTKTIPKWETSPTAVWVAEGNSLTAADTTYSAVQLNATKLTRLTRVSSEMFEDSAVDLAAFLARDIARSFSEAEDAAWMNGDGSNTHGGIEGVAKLFDDNQATFAGAIQFTTSADSFAEILVADLALVAAALPSWALPNAKWFISQSGWAASMEALAHALGGATVTTVAGKMELRWHGYPVVITEKLPTGSGNFDNRAMVLFGDMEACCILGDRRQLRLSVLSELYSLTDEVGIQATERIDIAAHGVGDATNAGAIVAGIGTA